MRRRLPPEPVVVITPGDYLDAKSRDDYAAQKETAEERMAAFDDCPVALRRVLAAVADPELALYLYTKGVRDFETAERMKRLMVKA